jgi:hypothetical protein
MMKRKISLDQLNYLNIALMLLAMTLALARPFELFLLAYAVLGPLHYLTEISWLRDKGFYTRRRHDYLFLVLVGGLMTLGSLGIWAPFSPAWGAALAFAAFGSALVFVQTGETRWRVLAVPCLLAGSAIVARSGVLQSTFSLLLPTIIHVFLFTGLFILVGALKSRSRSGVASLLVFIGCSLAFAVAAPFEYARPLSQYVRDSYREFSLLNFALMTPFRAHDLTVPANLQQYVRFVNIVLYQSPAARAVMGFIAFAYTYHYLNWFSKTSIIQWHNIPRRRFVGIIALWIGSIGCYLCSYRLGLRWLYFLSMSHVLLEFPLNHLSFMTIGKELGKLGPRSRRSETKRGGSVPLGLGRPEAAAGHQSRATPVEVGGSIGTGSGRPGRP